MEVKEGSNFIGVTVSKGGDGRPRTEVRLWLFGRCEGPPFQRVRRRRQCDDDPGSETEEVKGGSGSRGDSFESSLVELRLDLPVRHLWDRASKPFLVSLQHGNVSLAGNKRYGDIFQVLLDPRTKRKPGRSVSAVDPARSIDFSNDSYIRESLWWGAT